MFSLFKDKMTLMDWYAGLALISLMKGSNPFVYDSKIVSKAFEIASLMVEESKKRNSVDFTIENSKFSEKESEVGICGQELEGTREDGRPIISGPCLLKKGHSGYHSSDTTNWGALPLT